MSHEIRTPMTAILGYTDLLMDDSLSAADRKTFLTTVRRNGEHLLQLINDILDLSKIEAGKMVMDLGPCHLPSTVADVASMMRPRAEQRGNTLEVRYTGPLPETIHTDGTRLRQVIVNLVGNAVKFTENGSIRIGVSFLPQWRSDQSAVSVEVTDTGIGIRQEALRTPVPAVHASRELDHPEVRGHRPGAGDLPPDCHGARRRADGARACPARGARLPSRFPRETSPG